MLTDTDKARISKRVSEIEARSGVQIVTAFTPRCDDYPELPWKAFGLGVAFAAAALVLAGTCCVTTVTIALALCLCTGLAAMLLTFSCPPFARLFLGSLRAEAEARQCAEGLFLQQELFTAPARRSVLLLVARFERRVVILPDSGLQEVLAPEALNQVVAAMTGQLRRGGCAAAFLDGLAALEPLLGVSSASATGNALPDETLEVGKP
jgi:uncharacterized membrane protein